MLKLKRKGCVLWVRGAEDAVDASAEGTGDTAPCRMTGVTLHTVVYPQRCWMLGDFEMIPPSKKV